MLPVVAVPESAEHLLLVLLLQDEGEHTASLLAPPGQRSTVHPLTGTRAHRDLLVEGALSGRRQQGPAGIQGPRLSEGNHLLPPGCRGQKCCLGIPQTLRTPGWWCPTRRNHGWVTLSLFSVWQKQLSDINEMNKTYQGEAVSSRWWGSEEATDGRRDNVVEWVAVPGVEKPNTWNTCVTNPAEQEPGQCGLYHYQCHSLHMCFSCNVTTWKKVHYFIIFTFVFTPWRFPVAQDKS